MNTDTNDTPRTPQVGDPATESGWTDRNPATVSYVSPSGKTVRAQRDNWKVVAGNEYDGSAQYEYQRDPDAYESVYTMRKNGRFVHKGESMRHGRKLFVGHRRRYYDPHF
jgi:hypothetical protein